MVGVYHAAAIIAKVAIVNCGVACIHRALQGWLLLIDQVLQALSPLMPCQFVWEGVDGARYLAVAPMILVACFFWLIVMPVVFPVARGAFNARTFCLSCCKRSVQCKDVLPNQHS